MCGIVGVLSLRRGAGGQADVVRRMTQALTHRGPDDEGMYLSGTVGLGSRRLSILDASPAGHQPMSTLDGAVTMVYNGEIYNYVELRKELESRGHKFQSSGDTEVLLRAYGEWGVHCLPRLNGMWAFLIYDEKRNTIFGSRDRFGMKPLYRYHGDDVVVFASEIKAIRASGLYRGSINWRTAAHFLIDEQLDDTDETFYEGIFQVPPGTAFEVSLQGDYRPWRFWALQPASVLSQDPVEQFAELFEDCVRIHARSDVPVGVHLSGGLDSTSIICALARGSTGATLDLKAFSYMDPNFDETSYIAETLRHVGATLHPLQTTPERLWDDFERMLWFQDEPVHAIPALIGYQLMRLAGHQGVKVVLNGQGADEVLGGYPADFLHYWHTLLVAGHPVRAWREISTYANAHRGSRAGLSLRQIRHFALTRLADFHLYQAIRRLYRQRRNHASFVKEFADCRPEQPEHEPGWTLNEVLLSEVSRDPLPLYLRVEDRNSMAHSIEVRLPFLDHRLVTFAFTLSAEWKMHRQWTKYILRNAMRGRIPESVRLRVDKMGFPTSWRLWAAGPLYERMWNIIDSQQTRERGIYNTEVVLDDFQRFRQGETDLSTKIFNLVQFELWARQINQDRMSLTDRSYTVGEGTY